MSSLSFLSIDMRYPKDGSRPRDGLVKYLGVCGHNVRLSSSVEELQSLSGLDMDSLDCVLAHPYVQEIPTIINMCRGRRPMLVFISGDEVVHDGRRLPGGITPPAGEFFWHYAQKPYSTAELVRTVESYVRNLD